MQAPLPAPPDAPDEAALLTKLRAGDTRAFEQLMRAYGGRLMLVAQRFMGNEPDACDALQDAFISAYRAIQSFDGQSKLSTWLHRIVVNACLMKLRTKRRRPEQSIETLLPTFSDDGHHARPVASWDAPVEADLEREELRSAIREKIDGLPDTYRNVLLLRDIEELDTAQAAELLGISENAVKTRLHRARMALRKLLDPLFSRESKE